VDWNRIVFFDPVIMSSEAEFTGGFLMNNDEDKLDNKDSLNLPNLKFKQQQRNRVKLRYWIIVIGLDLVFSGYNSYLTLQSSIHVEGGLGENA